MPTTATTTSVRLRDLTLSAFAVFGWELVVTMLLDSPIESVVGETWLRATHWLVTGAGWALGAVLLLRHEPWRAGAAADGIRGRGRRTAVGAAALLTAVGVRAALTQEWKPLAEITRLHDDVGAAAFAVSLTALVLYYLAETLVIVLLVGYGHRWGTERWGRPGVPWGGLALACTWGAAHLLLQGPAGGLYAMFAAVLYGYLHLAAGGRFGRSSALTGAAFLL